MGFQNSNKPQNVNSVQNFKKDFNLWKNKVPIDKLIFGIPLFAPLFPVKDSEINLEDAFMSYKELELVHKVNILKSKTDNITIDNVGTVYFNTADQLKAKINLTSNCGGYMFWEIAQDAQQNSIVKFFSEL